MIGYILTQLAYAALGFGALFGVSAAVTYWRGRRVRRDRAYWNGPA
jgi:hypothetical protein